MVSAKFRQIFANTLVLATWCAGPLHGEGLVILVYRVVSELLQIVERSRST